MTIAIDILISKPKAGIAYGNPIFVNDLETKRGQFKAKPFDIMAMLSKNYIDTCAVVRKTAWESVGGFDDAPALISYEDWDFWLSLFEKDWTFE